MRLNDKPNDTAKNYQIKGSKNTFAVISSVTNLFFDSSNSIIITAKGQLKNRLFSITESDLPTPLPEGKSIATVIEKVALSRKKYAMGWIPLKNSKIQIHIITAV